MKAKSIDELTAQNVKAQERLQALSDETTALEKVLGAARMQGASTAGINTKYAALETERRELMAESAALMSAIDEIRAAERQAAQEAAAAEYARLAGELVPMSLKTWQGLDALHLRFCEMARLYEQLNNVRARAGKSITGDEAFIHPLSVEKSWRAVNTAMVQIVAYQGVSWLEQFGLKMPDLESEYLGLSPIAERLAE